MSATGVLFFTQCAVVLLTYLYLNLRQIARPERERFFFAAREHDWDRLGRGCDTPAWEVRDTVGRCNLMSPGREWEAPLSFPALLSDANSSSIGCGAGVTIWSCVLLPWCTSNLYHASVLPTPNTYTLANKSYHTTHQTLCRYEIHTNREFNAPAFQNRKTQEVMWNLENNLICMFCAHVPERISSFFISSCWFWHTEYPSDPNVCALNTRLMQAPNERSSSWSQQCFGGSLISRRYNGASPLLGSTLSLAIGNFWIPSSLVRFAKLMITHTILIL